MKRQLCLILLMPLLLFWGCSTDKNQSSQTLTLSLSDQNGKLQVVDYQIRKQGFSKSQQQGRYQLHIFDDEGKVLQEINFERIEITASANVSPEIDFFVTLPLLDNAHRIEIYRLDGSSGHYQLNTDQPILKWLIPENISRKPQLKN